MDQIISTLGGGGIATILFAVFVLLCIYKGVRIVSQSEKHVVERFGRLRTVLGPGINFMLPCLDIPTRPISMRLQQIEVACEVKTKDNVFTHMKVR